MWQVKNEDSLTGGEEEGKAGWRASKRGTSQMRTHFLEGRKWEKWVGELRNVARCKQGLTCGGEERGGGGRAQKGGTWETEKQEGEGRRVEGDVGSGGSRAAERRE